MRRLTSFDELIASCRFEDAKRLLLDEIESGRLLDPRSDPYWPRFADRLAEEIEKQSGALEVVTFWESLQDFFVRKIEPEWGHAHKGHIYFRLGLACLPKDFVRGKKELEAAYKEDIELGRVGGSVPPATSQSAYVALTILERIDDSAIASQADRQLFIDRLFHSFNAAIFGVSVQSDKVEAAIKKIAPPAGLMSCLAAYGELSVARKQQLSFATVSLTGTVLEAILLAELYHRRQILKLPNGKNILKGELRALMEEAIRLSIFPTDSVRVAFELVHIFRNRLHPGNELRQKYNLSPRVAWTVSVFFEFAVIEWSKSFPKAP